MKRNTKKTKSRLVSVHSIKKVLWFFRLLDDDGKLSLTNISVWITLIHMATADNAVSPVDLGALLGALASYQAKRLLVKKPNE